MTGHPIESILKYEISSPDLLTEALLPPRASKSSKDIRGDTQGNRRLALLGDSVLQQAILEPWYTSSDENTSKCKRLKLTQRLTSPEEGALRVQNLARNTKLSEIAQQTGITAYVAKNPCQKGGSIAGYRRDDY
jgi:ribonuclease-3